MNFPEESLREGILLRVFLEVALKTAALLVEVSKETEPIGCVHIERESDSVKELVHGMVEP